MNTVLGWLLATLIATAATAQDRSLYSPRPRSPERVAILDAVRAAHNRPDKYKVNYLAVFDDGNRAMAILEIPYATGKDGTKSSGGYYLAEKAEGKWRAILVFGSDGAEDCVQTREIVEEVVSTAKRLGSPLTIIPPGVQKLYDYAKDKPPARFIDGAYENLNCPTSRRFLHLAQSAESTTRSTKPQRVSPETSLCSRFAYGPVLGDSELDEIASLLPTRFSKDQFETSTAFQTRLVAVKDKFHRVLQDKLGTPYIVVHARPSFDFFAYDADKRTVRLKFENGYADTTSIGFGSKPEYIIAKTKSTFDAIGTYEATNALGAKITVVRYVSVSRGISVAEDLYPRSWPSNGKSEYVTMTPEDAKSLKDNAAVLIVAEPRAPFVVREKHRSSPTFASPMDVDSDTVALVAEPLCVALLDKSSKQIVFTMISRRFLPAPERK